MKQFLNRLEPRQRLRLQRIGASAFTYAAISLCTWMISSVGLGQFDAKAWLLFVGYAVAANLVFSLLVVTGVNQRFADPSMTASQIFFAFLWGMIAIYFMPDARAVLLLMFYPAFSFGSLKLDFKAYLALVPRLSLMLLATILLHYRFSGAPVHLAYELTVWAIFTLVMLWFAVFGSYVYRTQRKLKQQYQLLRSSEEALQRSREQIRHAAETDFLTQLPNRRAFSCWLEREQTRAEVRPVSLVLMDVDHFKQINDSHGHDVGDQALIQVSRRIKAQLRDEDCLIRWGGEEFLLVLAGADDNRAVRVAERIRSAFEQAPLQVAKQTLNVTLSLGLAHVTSLRQIETAINIADRQLYRAKEAGRNCVMPPVLSHV